jgi:co-chaperonin GroES (HSP10)
MGKPAKRGWVDLTALQMINDASKQEIIDEAGDLSEVEVMYNQILVGIWKRPERTKGGIILTDNTRKEDDYQGKVCLVLKMGPAAFQDNDEMHFTQTAKVGDWVVLRPGDGWQLKVNDRPCRMLLDTSVKMIIPRPEMVY